MRLRFQYNWHWFWDTGNGDIGNQGVHEMDIARWGLGAEGLPQSVSSTGGKYVYIDDQETPNTQMATFDYGGKELMFEVRGLPTGPEGNLPVRGRNTIGNIFYGSNGWMAIDDQGFQVYQGDKSEKTLDEKSTILKRHRSPHGELLESSKKPQSEGSQRRCADWCHLRQSLPLSEHQLSREAISFRSIAQAASSSTIVKRMHY